MEENKTFRPKSISERLEKNQEKVKEQKETRTIEMVPNVFCNNFLDKVANHFWTLLHVQIGQSCKGFGWQLNTSRITVADI